MTAKHHNRLTKQTVTILCLSPSSFPSPFPFFPLSLSFSQALSKALLALRAEMTSHAEQQIIANASHREDSLNVQLLVDKHTKDLKVGPHHSLSLIAY